MARKDIFLKNEAFFYDDSRKKNPSGFLLRRWLIKTLRNLGVPVNDPCCEPVDTILPLGFNTATNQDVVYVNGAWVPVETSAGANTTTTSTSTSTTSTTTTLP